MSRYETKLTRNRVTSRGLADEILGAINDLFGRVLGGLLVLEDWGVNTLVPM